MAVALIAALLVPLVWTAPDWLARLGLDPDLLSQGRGYTRAMAVTLVPMLGVALYRTILTAAEKPTGLPEGDARHAAAQRGRRLSADDRRGTAPRLRPGRLRPRIAPRRDGEPRDPRRDRPARPDRARPPASTGTASPRRCASACRSASRPWPRSGSSWPRPSTRRPSAPPTSRPTRWRCGPPASPTLSRPRSSRPRWSAPHAPRPSAIPHCAGAVVGERPCPRADRRHAAARRARGRRAAARRSLLRRQRRRASRPRVSRRASSCSSA